MIDYSLIFNTHNYIMIAMVLLLFLLYFVSKKYNKLKKTFIVVTIIYNLIYLIWRTVFTLPLSFGIVSIIFGISLLLAELIGGWQSLVMHLIFWKPYSITEAKIDDFEIKPSVDVFIATYNEKMDILKKTINGCLNLQYPKELLNIYLCDDGRRIEVEKLCLEFGINYISREDNKHAKAGNINNALNFTKGEFIMLLDADMVPKSSFLEKTLGYFTDEAMGFVQTPQVFSNPDPFQFNLKFDKSIPNEQDFFMQDIQQGRANYNAVLHVGTNAVFRRKVIEEIGGIPTGTITEDMATGMLIQSKGYKSVFVKEVLCTGLSVESFEDLVKQRERWCRGNIQVTKKWNPITLKGLSLFQRIIYLDGLIYWFFGVQKLIYILSPIIYLIFGVVIINANISDLLLFWLTSFLATYLNFKSLLNKNRTITWSHIYEVAMAPFISIAAITEAVFSKPIPFKVTPKGINSNKTTISIHIALPNMILLIFTILAWIITYLKFNNSSISVINSLLINISWSVYNAFAIIMGILVCIERPRKRAFERLIIDESVELNIFEGVACKLVDISDSGAKVICENLEIQPKSINMSSENLEDLEGDVVWTKKEKGKVSLGIKFRNNSNERYKKIVKYISDRDKGYHHNK